MELLYSRKIDLLALFPNRLFFDLQAYQQKLVFVAKARKKEK